VYLVSVDFFIDLQNVGVISAAPCICHISLSLLLLFSEYFLIPSPFQYDRTPLIRTLAIRIGLALRVNLSRILQN